jgi:hypothetical protein
MSFKDATCTIDLSYRAPSGTTGLVTFHGVNSSRIHHDHSGHEFVKIYFAPGSDTAVSPENRYPWWLTLAVIGAILLACGVSVWRLLVGTSRAKIVNRRASEERTRRKTGAIAAPNRATFGGDKGTERDLCSALRSAEAGAVRSDRSRHNRERKR